MLWYCYFNASAPLLQCSGTVTSILFYCYFNAVVLQLQYFGTGPLKLQYISMEFHKYRNSKPSLYGEETLSSPVKTHTNWLRLLYSLNNIMKSKGVRSLPCISQLNTRLCSLHRLRTHSCARV